MTKPRHEFDGRVNNPHPALARWLLWLFSVGCPAVGAGMLQPLDTIVATARQHLEANPRSQTGPVEIQIGEPDPRLRLPACAEGLEGFSPPGAKMTGRTSVGVRCHGPTAWRVHLNARISRSIPVLVWARSLPRGHVLGPEDVRSATMSDESLPTDTVTHSPELIGMRLLQPVRSGDIARGHTLRKHEAVTKGSLVTLRFAHSNIAVNAAGIALSAGMIGERIRVRNSSSRRVLDAIVLQPGLVEVL